MIHTGWEDFPVGRTVTTQGVTVTESHVVQWAGLTGDWYPLHSDAVFAARSSFGQRVAHGPLTFALAVGLMAQTGVYGDGIHGWLGSQSLRAAAAVLIGDTIRVNATVTESRPSKRPERGVVTLDYVVSNQRDEVVMKFDFSLLMGSRSTPPTDR